MNQFDLTSLAEEWFVSQFDAKVNGKVKNVALIEFDLRKFVLFVIRYINDYHAKHRWKHEAQRTANIVHYQERQIYRILRKSP